MKRFPVVLAMLAISIPVLAGEHTLWNDDQAEVFVGAYFNEAGTDTLCELDSDRFTVYLVMWNGSLRGEKVIAVEYSVELPESLTLVSSEIPEGTLVIGTELKGMVQSVPARYGDGLLLNTLHLLREGALPPDARIRVQPHPRTGELIYVHRHGEGHGAAGVGTHLARGGDAILNPKLTEARSSWQPVKSH